MLFSKDSEHQMIIDKERFDFTCGGFATGAPASKNKVVDLN